MKYIVDIKGEIEGDYEIIGKYEERPQGEWKIEETPSYSEIRCPFCQFSPNEVWLPNFCSNCGADMSQSNKSVN